MINLISKIKQDRFWLILTACSFALITAYTAELFFNLSPCMLCIYQRIPYFILVVFSSFAIYIPAIQKKLSFSITIALVSEIILAGYHVAVEHHWIEESSVCQIHSYTASLLSTVKVASDCSSVFFKFMNLSIAEWNLFYATALLYCFIRKY